MGDSQVKVLITADAENLTQGLQKAGDAVKGITQEMQGHIGGLEKALQGLMAPVAALVSIFAGGAVFKSAVDGTVEWTVQSQKLQRALGGTTEEASILAVGINMIHGNVEDFLGGSAKLTRTLNKNEEAIKSLGVETRDVNGNFKSTPQLISEINARLGQFKEGTDRNAEAQKVYGKSYQEMLRYIKLTPEIMEEARLKAEKLHLLVGPEGVEKTNAYRSAMVDVGEVFNSVKIRIGNELLPHLTDLGVWFGQVGPAAVDFMVRALQGVASVLSYTTVQIGLAILVLRGPLTLVWTQVAAFGSGLLEVFQRVALGVQGPLTATASGIMGLLNPVTLIIVAVAAAAIGIEYWTRSSSRAAEAQAQLAAATLDNARSFDRWSTEALRNDEIMRSTKASAEEKAAAQERLETTMQQLLLVYPGLNKFLVDEEGHHRKLSEAIKLETEFESKKTDAQIEALKVEMLRVQVQEAALRAAAAEAQASPFGDGDGAAFLQTKRANDAAKAYGIMNGALKDLLATKKALTGEKGAGGLNSDGGDKSETEIQRLKAGLEARKFAFEQEAQAKGQFIEFSKAQEAQWLEENRANYALKAKESLEVDKMTFEAHRAVLKQGFEGEIEGLKVSLEAAKLNGTERIRIAQEIADKEAAAYGEGSKRAQAAALEVVKIKREVATEQRKTNDEILANQRNHDTAILDLERIQIEDLRSREEISATDAILRLRAVADEKFRIKEEELLEQISVDGRAKAEEEKLWGQLQALRDQHKAATLQSTQELNNELRKTDGLAGWVAGVRQYTTQAADLYQNFKSAAMSVLQGVQGAFAQGIQGMLSGTMNLAQGLKTIWKGIVNSVISAVAQMIAQWLTAQAAQELFGTASTTTATATAAAETTASLTAGAAGAWEAYGWIPYVGAALALAQIEVMEASVEAAGITGFATGGLIDRPTLAWMGEAGEPEVVAPKKDFMSWANSLVNLGSNLAANIESSEAQVRGYGRQGAGFVSSAPAGGYGAQGLMLPPIQITGPILDTSSRGLRQLGDHVLNAVFEAAQARGIVLRPAAAYGGRS